MFVVPFLTRHHQNKPKLVSSSRGTCHVFPFNKDGGVCNTQTHSAPGFVVGDVVVVSFAFSPSPPSLLRFAENMPLHLKIVLIPLLFLFLLPLLVRYICMEEKKGIIFFRLFELLVVGRHFTTHPPTYPPVAPQLPPY